MGTRQFGYSRVDSWLGEIADGINGLIYLGEGRYIEAAVSAHRDDPALGDLGKAGKWTAKVGTEILEEAAEKAVKEVTEELVEKEPRKLLEEIAEKALKETSEEVFEQTAKEISKKL